MMSSQDKMTHIQTSPHISDLNSTINSLGQVTNKNLKLKKKPTITIISDLNSNSNSRPNQETEVTSTRPDENVVLTTKGLHDRNIQLLDGTAVENKGKTIN